MQTAQYKLAFVVVVTVVIFSSRGSKGRDPI